MKVIKTAKLKLSFLKPLVKSGLIRYYRWLNLINPTLADPYYQLGNLLVAQKDLQAGINCYQQAIDLHYPELSRVYYSLGNALKKLRRFESAIAAYQQSIAINPDFYKSYQEMAQAALQMCRWDIVVTACQSAIQINPNIIWGYYYLGQALLRQQQWESAIQAFYQAIKINPNYPYTYYYLSEAYLGQGQHEQNVKALQHCIHHNPEISELHKVLGDVLTQQNQIPEAIAAYHTTSKILIRTSHPHFQPPAPDNSTLAAPNFIIIGTVKGGTTSLYDYLTQHPQILPAIHKEVAFWDNRNGNFSRGLDWYSAHFQVISSDQNFITGEATPSYFSWPYTSEKLAQVFPNTKLILLLRNPLDRAISNYHMNVRQGRENSSLESVLLTELDFINTHSEGEWLNSKIRSYYIFTGLYLRHLQQWLKYFPREQFLILKSEDFFINPAKTVDQTFQFLGVESHQLSSYPIQNQGYYEAAPPSIRQALSDFFQPHNQALEQFLGQQFNWN